MVNPYIPLMAVGRGVLVSYTLQVELEEVVHETVTCLNHDKCNPKVGSTEQLDENRPLDPVRSVRKFFKEKPLRQPAHVKYESL